MLSLTLLVFLVAIDSSSSPSGAGASHFNLLYWPELLPKHYPSRCPCRLGIALLPPSLCHNHLKYIHNHILLSLPWRFTSRLSWSRSPSSSRGLLWISWAWPGCSSPRSSIYCPPLFPEFSLVRQQYLSSRWCDQTKWQHRQKLKEVPAIFSRCDESKASNTSTSLAML